ncbi:MAG: SufBD protein [bacterium]|nr:SufBD protein [bacterium]
MQETEIKQLVNDLENRDNRIGCAAMKKLLAESEKSSVVKQFLPHFIKLLIDENSYVRNRGLLLIAANARWDKENFLDKNLETYLQHLADEKPITARQCLKGLREIARVKPQLHRQILRTVKTTDVSGYNENMRLLLEKDLKDLQNLFEKD